MSHLISRFIRHGFPCWLLLSTAGVARAGTDVDFASGSFLLGENAPRVAAKPAWLKEVEAAAVSTTRSTAPLWDKSASDDQQSVDSFGNPDWANATTLFGPGSRSLPVPAAATMLTSGYLSTAVNVNYSAAPWVITTGDGSYPDLGGVATFNEQVGTVAGTFPVFSTVTLDVPVTLSGLTFNAFYQYTLAASGSGALSLSTTGTNTIDVQLSAPSSPLSTSIGHIITAPIGGGGTFGLTKIDGGTATLDATNTYTGGTTINGGLLFTEVGDAGLGATGTGNDVTINGGALGVAAMALTTARNFFLGSNGATLDLFSAASISGVVSGTGSLNIAVGGGLTLTAPDTYTGNTVLSGGSLTLSGNGSINASPNYDFQGVVTLDSTATNNNNRLNDTAPITARGVTFTLTGNSSTATAETVGAVTLTGGLNTFTVAPNSTEAASLAAASITRSNNSLLFVRGTGLGGTAGNVNVATITASGIGSLLVGGGGAAGSSTISIIPWAIGNVSTSALATTTNVNSSFVTYDPTNGFRPLTTSEYASSFTGSTTSTNVRLTAATAAGSGVNCNALVFAPAAAATLSGGTININGGAFLYSPSTNVTGTVSAALNFGTAEGIIVNTSKLTISGAISGSNGVTIGSPSATSLTTSIVTLSGASSYTGNTTLDSGAVAYSGTIAAAGTGVTSAFGASGTIVLNGGIDAATLDSSAASVLNRNISVIGTGSDYIYGGGNFTSVFNGNVSLGNNLFIYEATATSPSTTDAFTFNGNITGTGGVYDTGFTYVVLNGNNSYSGGTIIGANSTSYGNSTFVAGSNTAFGTGTIYFSASDSTSGTGTSTLSDSTAVTLANNLFLGATVNAFAGTGAMTITGGVALDGNETVSITNTSGVTWSGTVSSGGMAKSGAGTLTLSGANTYSGGTVVSAGTLLVNNTSGSGTGLGAVSVTAGTLGGTGFIVNTLPATGTATTTSIASGSIIQGGTGAATGALTLTGNLTLVSGSIIELGLSNTGSNSSLTRSGGTWTLPTGIKFSFTGSPVAGTTYDDLITGLAADPGTETGWTFTNTGFTGTFTYDGAGDIDLTVASVPEPATVLGGVLLTGVLAGSLLRRRQRSRMLA